MTTNLPPPTAQIIPFPLKVRKAVGGDFEQLKSSTDLRSVRVSDVSAGAWYHEAAIQDSKRVSER
jgi:hypothetical protein